MDPNELKSDELMLWLQDLPLEQRGDAVSSMVYEANARVRDPIYGCVGAISSLQQQVAILKSQLAVAQAEIVQLRVRQNSLSHLVMNGMMLNGSATATATTTTTTTGTASSSPDNISHSGWGLFLERCMNDRASAAHWFGHKRIQSGSKSEWSYLSSLF